MRVVLYQPDIAQNAGAILRLGACLGVAVDLIEPLGFAFRDHGLRRAAMDYLDHVAYRRHRSWAAFMAARAEQAGAGQSGRLVLLTTAARTPYTEFAFRARDFLIVGRESAGVGDAVRADVDASVTIPLRPGPRSLNVANALAMVLGEALRQTGTFPRGTP